MGNWIHLIFWGSCFMYLLLCWFLASLSVKEYNSVRASGLLWRKASVSGFFVGIAVWMIFIFTKKNPFYLAKEILGLLSIPVADVHVGVLATEVLALPSILTMGVLVLASPKVDLQYEPKPAISVLTRLFLVVLLFGSYASIWFFLPYNQKNAPQQVAEYLGTIPEYYISIPLFGVVFATGLGMMLWSFSNLISTRREEENDTEVETPKTIYKRAVVQDWYQANVITSALTPFDILPSVGQTHQHSHLSAIWKSVGGSGGAPKVMAKIDEKLKLRVEDIFSDESLNVGTGLIRVDSLPQPTELHFLAALCILGIEKGLRSLVVVHSESEANDVHTYLRACEKELYGAIRMGRVARGKIELNDCLHMPTIPAVTIIKYSELSDVIAMVWKEDRNDFSLESVFGFDIGQVLISSVDTGRLEQLTDNLFLLQRLFAAIYARGADPLVVLTTECGEYSETLSTNIVNGMWAHAEKYSFEPQSQSEIRIWSVAGSFKRENPNWSSKALHAIKDKSASTCVSDLVGVASIADIRSDGNEDTLHSSFRISGDASIAHLDERSFISSWRKIHNRASTHDYGHDTLWGWESSIVMNILENPKHLRFLHEQDKLPFPCPAYGRNNEYVVRRHLRKMFQEGNITTADKIFDPAIYHQYIKEVDKSVEKKRYVLRKDRNDKKFKRAEILSVHADFINRSEEGIPIVDINGGGQELFRVSDENASTRFYRGRIFTHTHQDNEIIRYEVKNHESSHSRLLTSIQVEKLAPNDESLPTDPIIEVIFHKANLVGQLEKISFGGINKGTFRLGTVKVDFTEKVWGYWQGENKTEYPTKPYTARYSTISSILLFENHQGADNKGFGHVAEIFDRAIMAYINADDADIHVAPFQVGAAPLLLGDEGAFPGVIFLDRHQNGMGVHEILKKNLVKSIMDFSIYMMKESDCMCADGCLKCLPERLRAGREISSDLRAKLKTPPNERDKRSAIYLLEPYE